MREQTVMGPMGHRGVSARLRPAAGDAALVPLVRRVALLERIVAGAAPARSARGASPVWTWAAFTLLLASCAGTSFVIGSRASVGYCLPATPPGTLVLAPGDTDDGRTVVDAGVAL